MCFAGAYAILGCGSCYRRKHSLDLHSLQGRCKAESGPYHPLLFSLYQHNVQSLTVYCSDAQDCDAVQNHWHECLGQEEPLPPYFSQYVKDNLGRSRSSFPVLLHCLAIKLPIRKVVDLSVVWQDGMVYWVDERTSEATWKLPEST